MSTIKIRRQLGVLGIALCTAFITFAIRSSKTDQGEHAENNDQDKIEQQVEVKKSQEALEIITDDQGDHSLVLDNQKYPL